MLSCAWWDLSHAKSILAVRSMWVCYMPNKILVVLAHIQLKSFYTVFLPVTSLMWENVPGPLLLNSTVSDGKFLQPSAFFYVGAWFVYIAARPSLHGFLATLNISREIFRCTYSQCMPRICISMTFEPTGNTCALLLVGMAHALGKVSQVQWSVRKMAKHMLKELEGSEWDLNMSPNARIYMVISRYCHSLVC